MIRSDLRLCGMAMDRFRIAGRPNAAELARRLLNTGQDVVHRRIGTEGLAAALSAIWCGVAHRWDSVGNAVGGILLR